MSTMTMSGANLLPLEAIPSLYETLLVDISDDEAPEVVKVAPRRPPKTAAERKRLQRKKARKKKKSPVIPYRRATSWPRPEVKKAALRREILEGIIEYENEALTYWEDRERESYDKFEVEIRKNEIVVLIKELQTEMSEHLRMVTLIEERIKALESLTKA